MGDTAVGDPTEGEAKPAVIHQLAESPLGGRTEGQDVAFVPQRVGNCLVKGKLIAAARREWTDEVSGVCPWWISHPHFIPFYGRDTVHCMDIPQSV